MKFNITYPHQNLKSAIIDKINNKTKPLGSLGFLESIGLQICLVQQTLTPQLLNPTMLIFCGDHGVVESGVSPYPQTVTAQMVLNFLEGGAAINVFSDQNNMTLRLIDSGVNFQFLPDENLINAKIAPGTRNFCAGSAMTLVQCTQAIERGGEIVKSQIEKNCNIFAFGEMGIGNTSSASCLMSVLCEFSIEDCVGRGTGLDDTGLVNKAKTLSQAIKYHGLNNDDPLQVLSTFGGFEIAMMVGAMLEAAENKCTLLIDGFITTAAFLVAAKIQPNIIQYAIFTHCSDESGHKKMLEFLKVKPLLNLSLRLGEGTGAALAYPLVLASVNFINKMASFESASVSKKI